MQIFLLLPLQLSIRTLRPLFTYCITDCLYISQTLEQELEHFISLYLRSTSDVTHAFKGWYVLALFLITATAFRFFLVFAPGIIVLDWFSSIQCSPWLSVDSYQFLIQQTPVSDAALYFHFS